MMLPTKEIVESLRKAYPAGSRVVLVKMDDPYSKLAPGAKGTVKHVDDMGTIHVSWDCGSSLGVAYGEDSCKRLDTVTVICYGQEKVWDSRQEAIDFYFDCMQGSEGCERDRYTNIFIQLQLGKSVCSDEKG